MTSHPDRSDQPRPLPLTGVIALDLGQIYQGSYAGFLMAQAGARVIKIEPPGGEPARRRGPNLAFAMLNGGKESVVLDLKEAGAVDTLKRLVANADVMSMNFAPGVPERLGVGYDDLRPINPRLIYAQASGFGIRNPDGSMTGTAIPAMDITVQAHMGAMSVTGNEGEAPLKSGAASIDFLGGTHLYGAITTALFERERTGIGRAVEVSMADATYFTLATALGQWQETGATMRTGNRHAGLGMAPYNVYECADGHVAVICVANKHWRSILDVIGRSDLLPDERFRGAIARAKNMAEVDSIVESWTSTQPKYVVARAFQEAHIPAAAVRSVGEIIEQDTTLERRSMEWRDHPDLGKIPLARSPIRYHDSELWELEANRALGVDTERVLAELA